MNRKILVFLEVLVLVTTFGCATIDNTQVDAPTTVTIESTTTEPEQEKILSAFVDDAEHEHEDTDGWGVDKYRPIYYDLAGPFADIVGRSECDKWEAARNFEESQNECIAVSFIKFFNVKKEDFEQANEKLGSIWLETGSTAEDNAIYEIYDVELIYTFDNEKINEFYLWENGPYRQ